MKVGDLVKWMGGDGDDGMIGIIVQLSRTGHDTTAPKVVFSDGYEGWQRSENLEVVNESR